MTKLIPDGKTPIGYLQELCNKRGTTAQYDVIGNEGTEQHQSEFVMQAMVGDKTAIGRGSSKKKAKHAAALAIIQTLTGKDDDTSVGNGSVDDDGDDSGQNPIGELQEFSQKSHLKPPEFITSSTKAGQPTDIEFSCECRLGKHTETGVGSSKKSAKRNAAVKMLAFIKSPKLVKSEVIQDEEEEEEDLQLAIDVKNRIEQAKLQGKNLPVSDAETTEEAREFWARMTKAGRNKGLHKLNPDEPLDYVSALQDIAKSQSIQIRFIDLPEISKTGQHQCLLELSTQPLAVVHGTGPTKEDTHTCAAKNAILYLKVMLRDL